jgi:hypothetical protein
VSKVLQENVLAHFQRMQEQQKQSRRRRRRQQQRQPSIEDSSDDDDDDGTERSEDSLLSVSSASSAFEKVKEAGDMVRDAVQKSPMATKLGVAAVAGGLVGGAAGLVLAGPAGGLAGAQLGKVIGAGGAIIEGATFAGVLVAGVATGATTGVHVTNHVLTEQEQQRTLTMGEDGISQKLHLVRPNIQIDPAWDKIVADARRSAPSQPLFVGAADRRKQRASDIYKSGEHELETKDKVLLLVSRTLNDKNGLPGHMYRYLIEAFQERCLTRKFQDKTNSDEAAMSPRARRDDAHAVIKHVTAALLEVRPELGASPAFTELTATAVEGLVFGQLYDLVFEEIQTEMKELDAALRKKVKIFQEEHGWEELDLISEPALKALQMLPEAHSAVDKLHFCVQFLERISEHFSSKAGHVCADSLLKMVCQHLVVSGPDSSILQQCNAEVAFLEEFARDEQLLRGKEGYSLVTLQASLHFLNMSSDLSRDIFAPDEDDVCVVPTKHTTAVLYQDAAVLPSVSL